MRLPPPPWHRVDPNRIRKSVLDRERQAMTDFLRVSVSLVCVAIVVAADVMAWPLSGYAFALLGFVGGWMVPIPAAERKAAVLAVHELLGSMQSARAALDILRAPPPNLTNVPVPPVEREPDPEDTARVDMREGPR